MILKRQRGISLMWVLVASLVIGGGVALALISMRQEKNLFAEMFNSAKSKVQESPAGAVIDGAKQAAGSAAPAAANAEGPLRKCVIDGKTVYSNTECSASNSKEIKVHKTAGVESPKMPVASSASATSDPMLDKAIEKQFK